MGERDFTLKMSLGERSRVVKWVYEPIRVQDVRSLKKLVKDKLTGLLYSSSFVAIFQQVNLFYYRYVPIFMYITIHI